MLASADLENEFMQWVVIFGVAVVALLSYFRD